MEILVFGSACLTGTHTGGIDSINNIYEIEGNGSEWTQEAKDNNKRVCRGGWDYGQNSPFYRIGIYPHSFSNNGEFDASRITLYVK